MAKIPAKTLVTEEERHKRFVVTSQRDLAVAVGVSLTTIKDWRARGMPVQADGNYFLGDVCKWSRDYIKEKYSKGNFDGEDLDSQLKEIKLNREKLGFLNDKKALVFRGVAEAAQSQQNTAIRLWLEQLPKIVCQSLPEESRDIVARELQIQFTNFLRRLVALSEEPGEEGSDSQRS